MSNRLNIIREHIASSTAKNKIGRLDKIVSSVFDYLQLSQYLTPKENNIRLEARKFTDKKIEPVIVQCIEKYEFPHFLKPQLIKTTFYKALWDRLFGFDARSTIKGVILAELARGDAGIALHLAHSLVLGQTIKKWGNQAIKKKYLPKLESMQMSGQVEPNLNLMSGNHLSTQKIQKGYSLSGTRKSIANKDLLCILIQNQLQQIDAYLLEPIDLDNLKIEKHRHMNFLRSLPHYQLTFNNTVVSQSLKLSSKSGDVEQIQKINVLTVLYSLWIVAGICIGAYEASIKYATTRQQFGRSISGFQLIQEKLVKMMANTQGILLLCFRVTKLNEEGILDLDKICTAKSYITSRARQICRYGRQIHGGNGILHEHYVIRALADIEYFSTIQGSSQQNASFSGMLLLNNPKQ